MSNVDPNRRPSAFGRYVFMLLLGLVLGAMAVVYGMESDALSQLMAHQMDWVQAFSFMLFTLIYTPCLSTVATMRGESKSVAFTGASIVWSLGLAWLFSFVFYQGARLLGL